VTPRAIALCATGRPSECGRARKAVVVAAGVVSSFQREETIMRYEQLPLFDLASPTQPVDEPDDSPDDGSDDEPDDGSEEG
jgi:hypothetical protein